jgi:RNA polymerase sigma factor (sigma-70 family)
MQNAVILPTSHCIMNRELFSGIIREHHSPLMAYARMITGNAVSAGDVVQDSFVVAWQNISKFDVTRDIGAWLRGIVRNKWREACRHAGREITMDEESLAAIEEIVSEWQADRPEIFDHLAGCREQLPAPLAESINAYYDQSLSTDEAAAQLGINGATLRKRLERAREALRECVQNKQATK